MMITSPKVSVVMPTYNAATYVDQAVQSVLNQTFRDFEFIIVDDGSLDGTSSILDKYQELDGRVRVHHQENEGMIPALNRGCRLARGQYIARMDADDVSFPQRLEKQVEYIETHRDIGVLGAWIAIEKNGIANGNWCPPTNSKLLKWTLFFGVCVAHPSVLMRREVIHRLNFYSPDAVHAEDVDLWLRASAITEFGNVPEVLLQYRVWNESTSQIHLRFYRERHVRLLASFIKEFLNSEPPIEAVNGLRQLRVGPLPQDIRQIRLTAALIQELYKAFMERNHVDSTARREISWDAAKKIAYLALQASRVDPRGFISLFMRALKLDHRLLHPSAVIKGLGRALEQKI
jgi:glycosyltransferase involved in cell wall biosynthesis